MSQFLIDTDDQHTKTASLLHLNADQHITDSGQTAAFLNWVKNHLLGTFPHPVAVGVYMNTSAEFFGGANTEYYDHIVSVWGMDDTNIYFSDHGLYTPDGSSPIYMITCPLSKFQAGKNGTNISDGEPYYLPNDTNNFGLAITGVIDDDGVTLPVTVMPSVNREAPEITDKSDARPASAGPLSLTVTVSGMAKGTQYNLYRYDDYTKVPSAQFNYFANQASASWQNISSDTGSYILNDFAQQPTTTDKMFFYRAIPVLAK